jgi:hypothetical protein
LAHQSEGMSLQPCSLGALAFETLRLCSFQAVPCLPSYLAGLQGYTYSFVQPWGTASLEPRAWAPCCSTPGPGVALSSSLLDLSQCLPTAGLRSLQLLLLHSNLLTSVPAGLAHLPMLTRLDLRDNQLRDLPPELLDAPFVRLQGNPLGEASADPLSPPGRLGVR